MEKKTDIDAAARETYTLLISRLNKNASVHIGTLVSAASRLAGASLYRSFNFKDDKVPPGTIVLSEEANQEWPNLMNMLLATLKANGMQVDQTKFVMQTPEQHKPHLAILEMQAELQGPFNQILSKHALDYRQGAFAGANACAIAILKSRLLVDPQITCGLAALGFVEGSKTAPLPLDPEVTNR
jgi:hypothetical protein